MMISSQVLVSNVLTTLKGCVTLISKIAKVSKYSVNLSVYKETDQFVYISHFTTFSTFFRITYHKINVVSHERVKFEVNVTCLKVCTSITQPLTYAKSHLLD